MMVHGSETKFEKEAGNDKKEKDKSVPTANNLPKTAVRAVTKNTNTFTHINWMTIFERVNLSRKSVIVIPIVLVFMAPIQYENQSEKHTS